MFRNALSLLVASSMAFAAALAVSAPSEHAAERGPAIRQVPAPAMAARVVVRLAVTATNAQALAAPSASESPGGVASRVVLRNAQALSQRLGLTLADGHTIDARTQVVLAAGLTSDALAARLRTLDGIEFAEPDQRRRAFAAPNDPLYAAGQTTTPAAGQWYLRAPTAPTLASINAEAAWLVSAGSASIVVADIDTGARFDHPDLATKLYPGYDFVTNVAVANDGDGRDGDASDPGDWITAAEDAQVGGDFKGCGAAGSSWHGTETAGLIGAATNNGIGMASVGHDVMVMPLRVLGKCGGYDSDIAAAMLWAAGIAVPGVPANPHPARVINMSLGGTGSCSALYQSTMAQVTAAGVVVVASAGNDGLAVNAPANCPGVIAVGGLRHAGSKVGYSSLGPQVVISAPAGNCVNANGTCLYPLLTTRNTGTTTALVNTYSDGDANPSLGTSFSSPLVAGTVALMLSVQPSLTPAQVITALKNSARPFPTSGSEATVAACLAPSSTAQTSECYCTTTTCGAGMLDAGSAVALVAAGITTPAAAFTMNPSSVVVGTPVTFNGSSSAATAGRTIVAYAWSVSSGSGSASFTGSTNASTATLNPTAAGTVSVTLTVTDSAGASASTTSTFTIAAAPVVTPSITAPPTITVGTAVSLSAGATVPSGRTIASYSWSIVNGTGVASLTGSTTGSTVTLTPAVAGTVTVSVTVTDSAGTAGSASKVLTIAAQSAAVVSAVISTPPAFTAGNAVTLSGAGSSVSSGSIVGYAWSIVNGTGSATISGAANASTVTIAAQTAGTIIVSLVVTDAIGTQGTASMAITITAAGAATVVPSIQVPASSLAANSSATLTGSATVASGRTIAAYAWTVVNGTGAATLQAPTNASTVALLPAAAGTVSVTLTVTDSAGVQGSTTTMLTITAASVAAPASSGGGGVGAGWLLALLLATFALWRADAPRQRASAPAPEIDRRTGPHRSVH